MLAGSNKQSAGSLNIGSGFAEASKEMSVGVNMLSLMATGFCVGYYVGSTLFASSANRFIGSILFGVLGLITAMLIEMVLFVIRDRRGEQRIQAALKRKQAQQLGKLTDVDKEYVETFDEQQKRIWEEQKRNGSEAEKKRIEKIMKQKYDLMMKRQKLAQQQGGWKEDADESEQTTADPSKGAKSKQN